MAACGSFRQIFEKPPLPENPILIDSLSPWNQINSSLNKPITEIFGELCFDQRQPDLESPSRPPTTSRQSAFVDLIPERRIDDNGGWDDDCGKKRRSASMHSFPSFRGLSPIMNSERLQLCTEGLGFESSDDMEDLIADDVMAPEEEEANLKKKKKPHSHSRTPSDQAQQIQSEGRNPNKEFRRTRSCGGAFPPPISCIGNTGKPRVSFQSIRRDGRFVLKEVRVPSREFLHAFRENGRLKLRLVQPEEGILEEQDEGGRSEEGAGGGAGSGDSTEGENGEIGDEDHQWLEEDCGDDS